MRLGFVQKPKVIFEQTLIAATRPIRMQILAETGTN